MNSLTPLNNNKTFQNIIFKIGKNKYALPLLSVLEIIELPQLETKKDNQLGVIGLLNFNNFLINVIDVRLILNENIEPYSIDNKIILAKTDETMFGIVANKIENVAEFSIQNTKNINNSSQIIDCLYTYNDETIHLINVYELENIIRNKNDLKNENLNDLFPKDKTSLDILHNRTLKLFKRFDSTAVTNVFTENKFITFLLENTIFCLNLNYAKEFIQVTNNITPLPGSPDYIEGLLPLKGDFITILNLKIFLNYSRTEYGNKAKVIILNNEEYKLGILVDEIYEIENIPEEKIQITETHIDNTCITKEYIDNNTVKPILDIEKLLHDKRLFINEN